MTLFGYSATFTKEILVCLLNLYAYEISTDLHVKGI